MNGWLQTLNRLLSGLGGCGMAGTAAIGTFPGNKSGPSPGLSFPPSCDDFDWIDTTAQHQRERTHKHTEVQGRSVCVGDAQCCSLLNNRSEEIVFVLFLDVFSPRWGCWRGAASVRAPSSAVAVASRQVRHSTEVEAPQNETWRHQETVHPGVGGGERRPGSWVVVVGEGGLLTS